MSASSPFFHEPYTPSLWRRKKLYLLSWEVLGKALEKIQEQILRVYKPTTIVGISRGGLVPATYLSHAFQIDDFEILGIARNSGDDTFCNKREPELLWASSNRDYKDRRVLLVDDVVGEGKTLEFTLDFLNSQGAAEIQTAVIARIEKSQFLPDYCAFEVDDWIVFPWEKRALDESKEYESLGI